VKWHLGMIMTEPDGVVGAITPWNFPVSMAGWKLGPALAGGNAVVLKPSELTPFLSVFLAQLAVKAGLPPGLINRRARRRADDRQRHYPT
jgi:aldehyde dehydrogenase (NAD+)